MQIATQTLRKRSKKLIFGAVETSEGLRLISLSLLF